MRSNWGKSLEWTLQEEGSEAKKDRGYLTKYGIDATSLSRARGIGVLLDELKELPEAEAVTILENQWIEAGLDDYPIGLDYFMFDCILFCGRGVSVGWIGIAMLRRDILGFGDEEPAARIVSDLVPQRAAVCIDQMTFQRRRRHRSQPGWSEWQAVWTNRVTRVQRRAKALLMQEQVEQPQSAQELAYG